MTGVLSEKATTHHYCQAKIKLCMHVVDIRHQERSGSTVIVRAGVIVICNRNQL